MSDQSFFAALPSGWELSRSKLIQFGERWEKEEAINDLRWWEDMIRQRRTLAEEVRPRKWMPSERELAGAWSWSKQRARKLLDSRPIWADPHFADDPAPVRRARPRKTKPPISPISGAAVGQRRGSSGAAVGHSGTVAPPLSPASGAAVGQQWGNAGAAVGRHARAQRQEQAQEQAQKKTELSSPSLDLDSSTWTAQQVLRVWSDAWQLRRGGSPCRGRNDELNAKQISEHLHKSKTSRSAFASACTSYLTDQEKGQAWPKEGLPMIGHVKRVWTQYLPGSRTTPEPWLKPYNARPAPMWTATDARSWLARNRHEVDLILEALSQSGGGQTEFEAWLVPRVAEPSYVLAELRRTEQSTEVA